MSHDERTCVNCMGVASGGGDRPSDATPVDQCGATFDDNNGVRCTLPKGHDLHSCEMFEETSAPPFIRHKGPMGDGEPPVPGIEPDEGASVSSLLSPEEDKEPTIESTDVDDKRARAWLHIEGLRSEHRAATLARYFAEVRVDEAKEWAAIVAAQRKSAYERGKAEGIEIGAASPCGHEERSAEAPLNCATHGSLDWPLRRRCRAPNWGGDCIQAKRPAVVEDIDWCRRRADIPGLNQEARDAILWLADHLEAARILNAKDQRSAEATNVSEFSHGFEVAREACIKWVEERCGYANAYAMAGDPATIDPSPCREGAVPVKPPTDVVEVAIAVALKHLFDARKRIEEGDDYLDDGPVANAVRDGIVWIRRARDGYREAQSQCGDGEQNAQCLTGCGRFALWCGPCTEDGENPRRERATPPTDEQRAWLLDEIRGAREVLASIQSDAAEGVPPEKFGERMREIYDKARARKRSLDSVLRVAKEGT